METESTLSTFTAIDGEQLVVQEWPLPHTLAQRGTVLIVHDLGEHAGRYDALACQLNAWGFAVRGYDQYGHGESGGARGALPTDGRLLEDLADLVESTRHRMDPGTPLLLLGQGMGAVVAARFVALGMGPVDGLVLASPAFELGLSRWQKLWLATAPLLAPRWRVRSGIKPQFLSHLPEVVAAYVSDPLVHDRISARLARFIASAGAAVLAAAPQWQLPTLLLYAGDDHVVHPQGSRDFAALAAPGVVRAHGFDSLYHDLFHERDAAPVWAALQAWVDACF